jgi:hypothetical protein
MAFLVFFAHLLYTAYKENDSSANMFFFCSLMLHSYTCLNKKDFQKSLEVKKILYRRTKNNNVFTTLKE